MYIIVIHKLSTDKTDAKELLKAYDDYNRNAETVLDSIAEGYDLFGIETESGYYQNYIKSREYLDSLIRVNNYR